MSKLDQLRALREAKADDRARSSPVEAKRGRGRPKIEGQRPWEVEGISKSTYYRRKKEAKK